MTLFQLVSTAKTTMTSARVTIVALMPERRASARPMSAASGRGHQDRDEHRQRHRKLHLGETERSAGDERALDKRGRAEDRRDIGGDAGERDVRESEDTGVAGEHLQTQDDDEVHEQHDRHAALRTPA